jgi:alpha-L-fucosidase
MTKLKPRLLLSLAMAACLTRGVPQTHAADSLKPAFQETAAEHDARTKWFRDARFGLFIHWGLYSAAAGEFEGKPTPGAGEWMMADMKVPVSKYQSLVPQFNATKFDARDWVRIAKHAGMKYICITTKHHDGFALYPSALTDWDIAATPFPRDPLQELAAACQAEGLTLCFYYSIMDWHHPDYAPRPAWNDAATNEPDFEKYVAFMKGQLKELLTGYGPIGTLWFDGCWESSWTRERGLDLYAYVRSLQPNILVNNRVGSTGKWEEWFEDPEKIGGDFGTPEQAIPPTGFKANLTWEACMTMNDTWGFKKNDERWKSSETLVRNLIDCASKGGNYLLNVGPTAEGLIPDASLERLKQVGDWMQANREAIYTTTASPFSRQLPWGRCTTKANGETTTLYLHVFNWPSDGELLVPGLKNKVKSAALLIGSKKLTAKNEEDGVIISVPPTAPNAISSTIVLQINGTPDVRPMTIGQKKGGSVELPASEAQLHGKTFKYESGGPLDDIGYWTNPEDWADWEFKVKTPGKFTVTAVIAAPTASAFDVSVAGKTLRCVTPATGDYFTFKPVVLGEVEIPAAGNVTLAVRPVKDSWQAINLKAVRLNPVK